MFFFSLCMSVSTWKPSMFLSHLVMHKHLPAGYFCTKKQSKLPAWMLLFEPCALKHELVLWLFLTHSSSRAGFSGAMERNVELGPQETQVRWIYHNLLHGYSFGFWHSSPDSGTKHPPASKDQSKPSLLWCLLMGWEPSHGLTQHFLTLLFLVQTSSQSVVSPFWKPRSTRWHYPPCSSPILAPTTVGTSTQSKIHIFLPGASPGASRLA